jgi:hypothetical protein
MKKKIIKSAAFISIMIVLFAVGVTAFHHHARVEDNDHCEICSFITTFSTAVMPSAVLFLAAFVLCGTIVITKLKIRSEQVRFNPSRAPPFIL